jgi:hypothetical protein
MTLATDLNKSDRNAILTKVIATVEMKHFDPHFDKDRWRTAVEERRPAILEAGGTTEFETALSDLVRLFGPPDSGFFHESSREKVPNDMFANSSQMVSDVWYS